jgi:predicted CoA-binding protein
MVNILLLNLAKKQSGGVSPTVCLQRLKVKRLPPENRQKFGPCLPLDVSCLNQNSLASPPPCVKITPMKTVAVIGASSDRNKFGNKAVRAFLQQGFTVYPVNPREATVEGLPAFPNIASVPERPQMVSVYLPPPVLLKVLPDIAAKGCDELWLNPGTESEEVLAEAERLKLHVIQACSIVAIGVSPGQL